MAQLLFVTDLEHCLDSGRMHWLLIFDFIQICMKRCCAQKIVLNKNFDILGFNE